MFLDLANLGSVECGATLVVSNLLVVAAFLVALARFIGESKVVGCDMEKSALLVVYERRVRAVSTNRYRLTPRYSCFFGVFIFNGELFDRLEDSQLLFDFKGERLAFVVFFIPFGAKFLFLGTFSASDFFACCF